MSCKPTPSLHTFAHGSCLCVLCGSNWPVAQWYCWTCSLFLLELNALKFDLSGIKRQRKHDILKSQYKNLQKLGPLLLQTWCQHVILLITASHSSDQETAGQISLVSASYQSVHFKCVHATCCDNTDPFVCICPCKWMGIWKCLHPGHWRVGHSLGCFNNRLKLLPSQLNRNELRNFSNMTDSLLKDKGVFNKE